MTPRLGAIRRRFCRQPDRSCKYPSAKAVFVKTVLSRTSDPAFEMRGVSALLQSQQMVSSKADGFLLLALTVDGLFSGNFQDHPGTNVDRCAS